MLAKERKIGRSNNEDGAGICKGIVIKPGDLVGRGKR